MLVIWRGMNFSTCWNGPKLLEQLEMVARTPYDRTQARTSMSAAALVAEYGLDGLYGVDSVNRTGSSSGRSPYTSSVDTWCSRT